MPIKYDHRRGNNQEHPSPEERVLHIVFDGTGNRLTDLANGSFMTSMHQQAINTLNTRSDALYFQGPAAGNSLLQFRELLHEETSEYSITRSARAALQFIRDQAEQIPPVNYDRIIVKGFSRGAMTAIELSNLLNQAQDEGFNNIPIDMSLIDAVMGQHELGAQYENPDFQTIPPNVQRVIHYERCREFMTDGLTSQYGFRILQRVNIRNPHNVPLRSIPIDVGHIEANGLQLKPKLLIPAAVIFGGPNASVESAAGNPVVEAIREHLRKMTEAIILNQPAQQELLEDIQALNPEGRAIIPSYNPANAREKNCAMMAQALLSDLPEALRTMPLANEVPAAAETADVFYDCLAPEFFDNSSSICQHDISGNSSASDNVSQCESSSSQAETSLLSTTGSAATQGIMIGLIPEVISNVLERFVLNEPHDAEHAKSLISNLMFLVTGSPIAAGVSFVTTKGCKAMGGSDKTAELLGKGFGFFSAAGFSPAGIITSAASMVGVSVGREIGQHIRKL